MNAAMIIIDEMREKFGEAAIEGLHIQPGRAGWMESARARALAHCLEAVQAKQSQSQREQREALVVPEGSYTMDLDFRTNYPLASHSTRKALRAACRRRGLRVAEFIRVRLDGSGEGHFEWPSQERVLYPKGTFCK